MASMKWFLQAFFLFLFFSFFFLTWNVFHPSLWKYLMVTGLAITVHCQLAILEEIGSVCHEVLITLHTIVYIYLYIHLLMRVYMCSLSNLAPMLQSPYAYWWIETSLYLIIYMLAALCMPSTDIVHFEMIAYSQKRFLKIQYWCDISNSKSSRNKREH